MHSYFVGAPPGPVTWQAQLLLLLDHWLPVIIAIAIVLVLIELVFLWTLASRLRETNRLLKDLIVTMKENHVRN